MAKIIIDREKCKGCLLCVNFCPKKLIVVDAHLNQRGIKPVRFSRPQPEQQGGIPPKAGIGGAGCLGCALCAVICPDCCIEVYK